MWRMPVSRGLCTIGLTLAAAWALGGCAAFGGGLNALGQKFMPPSPAVAARWMIDPHDPDNRRRGTVLIANSTFGGQEPYVKLYRDRVQHERDPLVKGASICALGRYGELEDAMLIVHCLNDKHFQIRWEAAKALQRIHNPGAVTYLLRTLRNESEDPDIRVAAAGALGQYAQDRVFQALVGALDAPQLAINVAARDSLTTLTDQDFGLDPRGWLQWYGHAETPFAGQQEYLFPTYQRKESWLERLVFWSSKSFEQPGTPAGLRSSGERSTYQDDELQTDGTGG